MKRPMTIVLSLVLATVPTLASAAGLVSVRQSIFGMDCAPCAYGLDKGLKTLSGVESVKVSLNEGYAELTFAPESTAGLADIQRITRDNGFTPKEATMSIAGTIQMGPNPRLVSGAHGIPLAWADTAPPRADYTDREVLVTGTIAADSDTLTVARIEQSPGSAK